jgi:cytochrome c nitrite reductase small subunit
MGTPRTGSGLKCLLAGVVLGVMLLAATAAAMRVTDQRPFCSSCHVMAAAALTHKLSSHANQSCNDCHTPAALVSKASFKASQGLEDITGNFSGKDISMPISLRTRDVVNNNCKQCHAMSNMEVAAMESKKYCVDCHRNIAHMRAKPISTRMVVANE